MTSVLAVVVLLQLILLWRLWVQSCELHIELSECQEELLTLIKKGLK